MLTNDDTDPRSVQKRLDVTNYILRGLALQLWLLIGLLAAVGVKLWF